MASNTEFLGLLMKDPVADKADTFNIETMLNENWRKIDDATRNLNAYTKLSPETAVLFGLDSEAVPDDVFQKIYSGFSRIATGSYVGTGTSGPTNACRVEVGFKPLVLIVFVKTHMSRMMVSCRPWTAYADIDITSTANASHCEWGDGFVSWYYESGIADSVNDQYNDSKKEYQYIVLG